MANLYPNLSDKKILLTGGNGFLGRHVLAELMASGIDRGNITIPDSNDCDLRILDNCQKAVSGKDVVIHLAARVGGIGFNREHPGQLFYDNLVMGTHLMDEARKARVAKFVAIGTICAYPKFTPVPFKEVDLWNGYPEETNAPYGLAKKMLLVQAQAYRQEYGFNAIYLLPVNLYGPWDNFDPKSSHVIPALIKKIDEANKSKSQKVEVWGTGNATREFLFVEDAAKGICLAADRYNGAEPVNIGSGSEISIGNLVSEIFAIIGFTGEVVWNSEKPDGQPRRMLDTTRAKEYFGFQSETDLHTGLKKTYEWYKNFSVEKN